MVNIRIATPFMNHIDESKLLITCQSVFDNTSPQSEFDVSLVIDDDQTIQCLNRDFLGIDAPTDVLSFYANEFDPDTSRMYLGDIIISFQRAQEQSKNAGHSIESEIQMLVVHGLLHLLGYDHDDEISKEKMWSKQKELLDVINVEIKQLPED